MAFRSMKTTLNLHDDLVARAKLRAAAEGTTLTRLIEEGLTLRLRGRLADPAAALPNLPVSRRRRGVQPGIDVCSNQSMLDAADP